MTILKKGEKGNMFDVTSKELLMRYKFSLYIQNY